MLSATDFSYYQGSPSDGEGQSSPQSPAAYDSNQTANQGGQQHAGDDGFSGHSNQGNDPNAGMPTVTAPPVAATDFGTPAVDNTPNPSTVSWNLNGNDMGGQEGHVAEHAPTAAPSDIAAPTDAPATGEIAPVESNTLTFVSTSEDHSQKDSVDWTITNSTPATTTIVSRRPISANWQRVHERGPTRPT